jgi:response regulator NasT
VFEKKGGLFLYSAVIADDEPVIKMDIREILETNGYNVVGEAKDGFEAVQLCRRHKPDFVIMDIKMPLLNGIKAAETINRENLSSCVLLLTAYSDKSVAAEASKANVMGYLVKPVDENSLIPAIEVALSKSHKLARLSNEFKKTKLALENRKTLDRAKGLLMDSRGMSEMEAYQYLRKVAMDKECTIAQVAEMLVL